ncbi:MAG: RNA polymerase sigma factor [candidate division Zixibacteria bacterium]|nr:RNA polymerase sigma factor [candidate division Zixibacteria bacterium]
MNKPDEFKIDDDKVFGQLVNTYKERIYAVVLRIVKNKDEAKDLAQEAFVKAYQNRKSFRRESGFYTWVYRIAVNLSLNYIKRNRDRQAESLDFVTPSSLSKSQPDQIERAELGQNISAAIDKLPARQKTVFVLRHYEEKPHAEIAEILSITEGAVKANYHQAVQKLKTYLGLYLAEGRQVQ